MSSAVASVEFKAINQQQVVSAFKSVGDSASAATTKVSQNSSALKGVSTGMKNSVSSIGNVTTAFAALSLSIVGTWRAYRDLHSQQLDIDKMNTKIAKAEQSLKLDRDKLNAATKAASKGGLEYKGHQLDIAKAEAALKKAIQEHGKKSLEAALAQQKLNEVVASGAKGSKEMADLETKIGLKEEGLANMKGTLKEKQKSYNDTIQDFYLSIAPTALSTVGLLTQTFSGLKGVIGSGKSGLIGSFGGLGLILGGAGLAIVAYQNNWLGFKDVVDGIIGWFKERMGTWKDTLMDVFKSIQEGKWEEAFAKIKEAATAFWEDLKKTVPLFGAIDEVVNKIKNGNWKGALLQIWKAAVDVWNSIKVAVPFLGDVEKFITGIAQGKWSQVFDAIKSAYTTSGLKTVIDSILGENWITNVTTRLQSIPEIIKSAANLAKAAAEKGDWKGVGISISTGISEGLKASGGQDVIDTMLKTGIGPAAILQAWKDPKQRQYWFGIGQATVTGIGEAFNAVVSFFDPYIAKFITTIFDPTTWTTLLSAASTTATDIGTAIITTIGSGISTAAADPAAMTTYWTDIGTNIWKGIVGWLEKNAPETTAAITNLVASFTTAVNTASVDFQNMGITIWNQIVDGIKFGIEQTRKNPASDFLFLFNQQAKDAFNSPEWKNLGHVAKIEPELDTTKMVNEGKKGATKISNMKPVMKIDANLAAANQKWNAFVRKVQMTTLQVKIAGTSVNIRKGSQAGAYGGPSHQHGYQGTVKRPTTFIAGEGGRPEDVTVRPRGSVQRGGMSGGGGSTHITISFEPEEFAQFIRYRINDNQGVVK